MTAQSAATQQQPQAQPVLPADDAPITLTDSAAKQVLAMFEQEKLPEEAGLRVAIIGGGCSGLSYKLAFESASRKRDKIYLINGVRVFMDPKSALYLRGTQLDFVDSLNGTGFTFSNPNAEAECGCGQSFTA
ncbi:MAG: iron-sulfur cluster assembly accessory protein [Chrysiogenetes bacterium]|nr:iron-sulfur cluster assembly accessory protein [Chrysiogenetes bacterium]